MSTRQWMQARRGRAVLAAVTAAGLAAATGTALAAPGGDRRPDAAAVSGGDRTPDVRRAIEGGRARNVILFIGDGMGESEITAARNYQKGAAGRLAIDTLPLTGDYTTYAVQKGDPDRPVYAPESASTGTAWATGTKTYNGAVSVDAYGNRVTTILELAQRNGLRTGDVTTAEVQDATPAVLASHVVSRDCKGPVETSRLCPENAKENGGDGSISEQLVQTRPDVIMGGGSRYFDQTVTAGRYQGRTVLDQARARGYQVLASRDQISAADPRKPILGLFAGGNMDVEWAGPAARAGGTEPTRCTPNPARPATQPRIVDMTRAALGALDRQTRGRPKGFFLQVEGASIDKQDHAANPCGQIGETVAFDQAVQAGLSYAAANPDTLVVVTADHAHTSQIIANDNESPGLTATLVTRDGEPMTINYGTAPAGASQEHTGAQVRVAAQGPQAANVVGLTDQTELFTTMRRALGLR